jgi:hypothetical protein
MDWTTRGASEPTRTLPIFAVTLFLRCMSAIVSILTDLRPEVASAGGHEWANASDNIIEE